MVPDKSILSIIESPTHPDLSKLYDQLGFEQIYVSSMRKALSYIKQHQPDFVVAEFYYGYGNNYAGVNISNLDVFLYSLEKYSPASRVIAIAQRNELEHAERLNEIIPYYGLLVHPVRVVQMQALLEKR